MKTYEELVLVNYCHPDCTPLMNIMRLPKRKAFEFAVELAKSYGEDDTYKFINGVLAEYLKNKSE